MTAREWFAVESTPTVKEAAGPLEERATIETREGTVVAEPGDYLLREGDGNEYPISAEKFARYYREVAGQGKAERGPFTWKDDDGHRAYGVVFPSGDVAMMWDRETWPREERLISEHMSLYGTVGDVLHANGGELTWGRWDVPEEDAHGE